MDDTTEQNGTTIAELMKGRDKIVASPQIRANKIWELLRDTKPRPRQWDIICFCVEYLILTAYELNIIQPATTHLLRQIYTIHYGSDKPIASTYEPNNESVRERSKSSHSDSLPDNRNTEQPDE